MAGVIAAVATLRSKRVEVGVSHEAQIFDRMSAQDTTIEGLRVELKEYWKSQVANATAAGTSAARILLLETKIVEMETHSLTQDREMRRLEAEAKVELERCKQNLIEIKGELTDQRMLSDQSRAAIRDLAERNASLMDALAQKGHLDRRQEPRGTEEDREGERG
jgi:hypothetical protein